MSGNAPALTDDQADLVALLDAVMSDHGSDLADERPDEVAALRHRLAGLGVWTLGVTEVHGGGGAGELLAATVFARLGRRWPALGLAAVQAHAAADVLGRNERQSGLLADIHTGMAAVAVVDAASSAVHLAGGRGRIDRVDAAGERPHVVVLDGDRTAWTFAPESLTCRPLRRTGLCGALTVAVEVSDPDAAVRQEADTSAARRRLRMGAAAVAAGLADAAADEAVGYSASRRQFGAELTALPTVRDSLFACSAAAAATLRQVLRPDGPTPWQSAAVLDRACEAAVDACARAVQAHGGYGYLTEYPAERLLRDALSLRAACDAAAARRSGAFDVAGLPDTT